MSKFNINFHCTWGDVFKQLIKIALSVFAILEFRKRVPEGLLPNDFIFTTAIYMCIYVLISLIIEIIAKKIAN